MTWQHSDGASSCEFYSLHLHTLMTSSFRPVLIACVCAAAGFVAGWFSRQIPNQTTVSLPTRLATAPVPLKISSQQPIATSAGANPSPRNRAETYAWLRHRNIRFHMTAFEGDSLNSELAVMLGLTQEEFDHINAAVQQTKQQLADLAVHAATGRVTADGKTLIVSVPPLSTGSDSIYNNLLKTITQALGPERYQLFSELTEDGFERNFDCFGLNPVNYELTLQPTSTVGDVPFYAYKRSYTYVDGSMISGSDSGTVSRSDLEKIFPALARFLPPDLGK